MSGDPGLGPEGEYWAALDNGRFMIQRVRSTGVHVFYPRAIAPGTGTDDLEWVDASGAGRVYATTTVRRKPERGGDYNLSIVELAEGPRLLTRVVGTPPASVTIGMAVEARVVDPDFGPLKGSGRKLVVFVPAGAASAR